MSEPGTVGNLIRDILAECSRKPHSRDPRAGPAAVEIIRRIEAIASKARDAIEAERNYAGPARENKEAFRGLNDVFPGDPCPPGGWRPRGRDLLRES